MHTGNIRSGGITESNIFNETPTLNNSYLEIDEENGNASFYSDYFNISVNDAALEQGNFKSVYVLYPSGLLWFGATSCFLLSIFGIFGNLISILALVNCKRLRNATTAFIVNLCVSDMFYCAFIVPLCGLTFINRDWKYGNALCKLYALDKLSNGLLSILTVIAITINRYVLICHPSIYETVYTKRNIAISIACLWLFPFALGLLPVFNVWGTVKYIPKIGNCNIANLNGTSPRSLTLILWIVLPSVAFISCYVRIYFVVKNSLGSKRKQEYQIEEYKRTSVEYSGKSQKKIRFRRVKGLHVELSDKKEFRMVRIMLVIFIVYSCTILPLSVLKLLHKEAELQVLNVIIIIFYFSSSVVNPVVYVVMSKEYRKAYKELFTSKICCNRLQFNCRI